MTPRCSDVTGIRSRLPTRVFVLSAKGDIEVGGQQAPSRRALLPPAALALPVAAVGTGGEEIAAPDLGDP